jgi:hypothetical protein
MKKKLLLLATAAVFLSPVAAKANQKGSVYVGLTGTLERLATQGDQPTVSDYLKDENYFSAGVEAGCGYKVWNNLQVAGLVRGLYSFEHKFADTKKKIDGTARDADPSAWIVEPRVTLGWEFPVNNCFSITPFIGAGFEMNFAKTKNAGKEYEMNWKIPGVFGVRANYSSVYVSLNGRFDITASEISNADAAIGKTGTDKVRAWGLDASVGAEF